MSAAVTMEHGKPLCESMTLNVPWSHRYKPALVAPHTTPAESTEKLNIMNGGDAAASVGDNVRYAIQIVRKFAIPRADPDSAGRIRAEKMSVRHERCELHVLLHPAVSDAQQMGYVLRIVVSDGPDIPVNVFSK